MAKKVEAQKERPVKEAEKDIMTTWADSYTAVSKMWEDSYFKLSKPWLETTSELLEKSAALSKEAAPQQYKEFYDEWMRTYKATFGKFYPVPTQESTKDMLEKFLSGAEESSKLYRSWIAELDENSRKTREMLKGKSDPAKFKAGYTLWMKSYEKIFSELLTLPAMVGTKEIFEKYTGMPDIYSESFVQLSKLWKDSFTRLHEPWIDSVSKLSGKMAEISQGNAGPEAYKEFYTLWLDTYQKAYGKAFDFQSMQPSKAAFEDFIQSTTIYLDVYKNWIATLEKLSEKAREITRQTADPKAYQEFSNLWLKMYERAFTSFFEDMPLTRPMREMMEPAKVMAKIYQDSFSTMAKMWVK